VDHRLVLLRIQSLQVECHAAFSLLPCLTR
jgi:hypothetical protein